MDIAREAWQAVTHHHDKETPMTTPPRNVLADMANIMNDLGSNQLITRLASEGLGRLLTASDIEHVAAIVRAIEQSRRGPAMPDITSQPMPQRMPQPVEPPQPGA